MDFNREAERAAQDMERAILADSAANRVLAAVALVLLAVYGVATL